jgi:sulfoxide reductase heme-binding subunit YedZ
VIRALKVVVLLAALLPAAWLTYALFYGGLGANPAETLQLQTGIWALRLLVATLAITAVRREDVVERPFITMGMVAFLAMVPLAITSTKGWIRRLGRRWQLLHRLVYLSAIAAAIHYLWKVKVMIGPPVNYALLIGALLLFRVWWAWRGRVTQRP